MIASLPRLAIATAAATALAGSLLVPITLATAEESDSPLAVGDCLVYGQDVWIDGIQSPTAQVVDCVASHNAEIFAVGDYTWDAPPSEFVQSDAYFTELYDVTCSSDALADFLGERFGIPTRLEVVPKVPTDEEWSAGARWTACAVFDDLRRDLVSWTGTLPDRVAASLRSIALCSRKPPVSGADIVRSVCNKKAQWIAVFGIFGLTAEAVPGAGFPGRALQREVNAICKRSAKDFTKPGAKARFIGAVVSEQDWNFGIKAATCFIPVKNWNGRG